jgi:hypothetical protein
MDTFSSYRDSSLRCTGRAGRRKLFNACLLISSVAVLSCLLFFARSWRSKWSESKLRAHNPVAELVSASGVVLKGDPGQPEWRPVSLGARLMEGDLIKTDSLANALVRYTNGTTVSIKEKTIFAVRRAGNGSEDRSIPLYGDDPPSRASGVEEHSSAQSAIDADKGTPLSKKSKKSDNRPLMKLDRIVAFGRSLELTGTVEAGSQLCVNDEIVDIDGNGSFKHFTKAFPGSASRIRFVMKVTDLAGRTRSETVAYDFDPRGGIN